MSLLKKINFAIAITLFAVPLTVLSEVKIEGFCYDHGSPQSGVNIQVIGATGISETLSNLNGAFYVSAVKGNVVKFIYRDFEKSLWVCANEINLKLDVDISDNHFHVVQQAPKKNNSTITTEGVVYNEEGPISGFPIKNQNNELLTITNFDGFFSCKLKPNETAHVDHLDGLKPLLKDSHTNYINTIIYHDKKNASAKKRRKGRSEILPISLHPQGEFIQCKHHLLKCNLIKIPGGYYQDNCQERRRLNMAKTTFITEFYLMDKEVTNDQFCTYLNAKKVFSKKPSTLFNLIHLKSRSCKIWFDKDNSTFKVVKGYENHPVVNVTWKGANAFAKWSGGRLPLYSEWQFAVSSSQVYNTNINEHEWLKKNANKSIHPCGSLRPYYNGFYDLLGNVKEWTADGSGYQHTTKSKMKVKVNPFFEIVDATRTVAGSSFKGKKNKCALDHLSQKVLQTSSSDLGFRIAYNCIIIN